MIKRFEMNPKNSLVGIVIAVAILAGLYFMVKGFFLILNIITPGLLLGAAILNWRVFPDYAKWIWKTLNANPIMGLIAILFTFFLYPVAAGYLFVKALFRYQSGKFIKNREERRESEFVEFEEMDNRPVTPLELPRIEKTRVEKPGNTVDYDQLFD